MTNKEKFIELYHTYIKREGADKLRNCVDLEGVAPERLDLEAHRLDVA